MFYKVAGKALSPIQKKQILEKDVQNLVESNLSGVFDLEFVDTEFSIENVRFDTLAFDREANSPVIIEFKKSFDKSLFDQGLEYLNLLFSRKADFAVTLHKKLGLSPDPDKYAWENARVIFVCEQYSERQKRAISFQGLPVELYRFAWLENDFFQLEKETLDRNAKLSEFAKSVNGASMAIQKVRNEVKDYDRSYHKKRTSQVIWELFEKVEEELLNWKNFDIRYRKNYIGVQDTSSFCFLSLLKTKLLVQFGKKKDKKVLSKLPGVRDISNRGWNHAFIYEISSEKELPDLFFVLKKYLDIF